jgi:hypothetical protein
MFQLILRDNSGAAVLPISVKKGIVNRKACGEKGLFLLLFVKDAVNCWDYLRGIDKWLCMEYIQQEYYWQGETDMLEEKPAALPVVHHKMNPTVLGDGLLTIRLRRGNAGSSRGAASGVFPEYHEKTSRFSCHQGGSFEGRTFQLRSISAVISAGTWLKSNMGLWNVRVSSGSEQASWYNLV